jgi:hypothetical protein
MVRALLMVLQTVLAVGTDPIPVAMVIETNGKVSIQSPQGKSREAVRKADLFGDDVLIAEKDGEALIYFHENGVRQKLKPGSKATVRFVGCEPMASVETLEIPKKYPNGPDNKSGAKSAGASLAFNSLHKQSNRIMSLCLATRGIEPAFDDATEQVFYRLKDAERLKNVWTKGKAYPDELIAALFHQAIAVRDDDFSLWLLRRQATNSELVRAYIDYAETKRKSPKTSVEVAKCAVTLGATLRAKKAENDGQQYLSEAFSISEELAANEMKSILKNEKGRVQEGEALTIQDKIDADGSKVLVRTGPSSLELLRAKIYPVKLSRSKRYRISLDSGENESFLIVRNEKGSQLAYESNSFPLEFEAPEDGIYMIEAASIRVLVRFTLKVTDSK